MERISTDGDGVASLSDAELAEEITTWSGRVAAGEARLLALIGEFDVREAWGGPGLLSCAHWLSWRTGLSPGSARERVRVARALRDLPLLAGAMASGRMSFSQARAVTRVATPEDSERWVQLCRFTTAGQLERLVRGVRRVRRIEQDEADPERAVWRRRVSVSYDADGDLVVSVRLSAQDGAVLLAALEQAQAELDQRRAEQLPVQEEDVSAETSGAGAADSAGVSAETSAGVAETPGAGAAGDVSAKTSGPTAARGPAETPGAGGADGASAETSGCGAVRPVGTPEPRRATMGEALLELARRSLDRATPDRARRSRARLTAQLDPLSGWARLADGELLPPQPLTGVTSLADVLRSRPARGRASIRPLQPEDLTRHDLGRTARLPSDGLRQLLGTIDGERCRFPGCSRVRRLHAHHVRRWSDGGPTDLANLLLLCSRHHTLVHAQGFGLHLADDRTLTVMTADGEPVLHHPALPWGDPHLLDHRGDVSAERSAPTSSTAWTSTTASPSSCSRRRESRTALLACTPPIAGGMVTRWTSTRHGRTSGGTRTPC